MALVGESGCGKTTLARSIMGLQRPLAGEIRVRGEALRYNRRSLLEHRRSAQMIFQDPTGALNARQTIYEAVAEGVRIQKLPGNEEELVAEGLSRAGLRPPEQFFTRYPYEISGGQRQRVIIAGAMVLNPSLLVADEPVSSLDASIRGEILALMLKLVRETARGDPRGHPRPRARLERGRPRGRHVPRPDRRGGADRGDPERAAAPLHARAALGRARDRAGGASRSSPARRPTPRASPPGCRFHPRCPLVESGEAATLGIEERCRARTRSCCPACHAVR